MCGPSSAIGLADAERELWPEVRERLRQPGALMGLMRGLLGSDAEVAAVVATTPDGIAAPIALLATPALIEELSFGEPLGEGWRAARIGDYDVTVAVDPKTDRPIAIGMTPWIFENLTLFGRKLWSRRPRP